MNLGVLHAALIRWNKSRPRWLPSIQTRVDLDHVSGERLRSALELCWGTPPLDRARIMVTHIARSSTTYGVRCDLENDCVSLTARCGRAMATMRVRALSLQERWIETDVYCGTLGPHGPYVGWSLGVDAINAAAAKRLPRWRHGGFYVLDALFGDSESVVTKMASAETTIWLPEGERPVTLVWSKVCIRRPRLPAFLEPCWVSIAATFPTPVWSPSPISEAFYINHRGWSIESTPDLYAVSTSATKADLLRRILVDRLLYARTIHPPATATPAASTDTSN